MKKVTILKAKLVKAKNGNGNKCCVFDYKVKDGDREDDIPGQAPNIWIHADLQLAFNKLIPHMLLMKECSKHPVGIVIDSIKGFPEGTDQDYVNKILIERDDYQVTSISMDEEGVVLSGNKKLSNNKVDNFNTPYYRFDGSYPLVEELKDCLDEVAKEVTLYLDGKATPFLQMDLLKDNKGKSAASDEEKVAQPEDVDEPETHVPATGKEIQMPVKSTSVIDKPGLGKSVKKGPQKAKTA